MSKISRELTTLRSRFAKLNSLVLDLLDLQTQTAKPHEVMLTVTSSCVQLVSAFDFGSSIAAQVQPGLVLLSMKANTDASCKSALVTGFSILGKMRSYLEFRIAEIDKELKNAS